jgi:predicted RecB family endonuclease
VPATGDAGFAVYAGRTGQMPRVWCTSAADLVADDDGRYAAEVRAGRLVVGDAIADD